MRKAHAIMRSRKSCGQAAPMRSVSVRRSRAEGIGLSVSERDTPVAVRAGNPPA
ncbi:hypothetical protein [Scytonema sp. HK-05]